MSSVQQNENENQDSTGLRTDTGNAERLVEMHGHEMRYAPGQRWMIYDGKRWVQDETGQIVEWAKNVAKHMYDDAWNIKDKDKQDKSVEWAVKSASKSRIDAMIDLAKSDRKVVVLDDQFDADPMLLNVLNGTLDLRTGELRPHNPEDLLTKLVPVSYKPLAKSELFERFLNEVFAVEVEKDVYENDPEMVAFIQRAIGYSLTGETKEPAFFIPHGNGRNGKSTLLNTAAKIMDDYADVADKDTFLRKERSGIPEDKAKLRGVRMVLTSETEQGERLNISFIKQATGGDRISAREPYGKRFTFKPQMKIWMSTNIKPEIPEGSTAIWARVKLIPFDVSFIGREDTDMENKLLADSEAILAWMVEGCKQWQNGGLRAPERVKAATKKYQAEQDILGDFFSEKCAVEAGCKVQSAVFYKAYTDWCTDNYRRPIGDKDFSNQLEQRGFKKSKSNGRMTWFGIGLADERPSYATAYAASSNGKHNDYPY